MPSVAFCVPIIPGKEETDRKGFEEAAGPRREEYDALGGVRGSPARWSGTK